ncbi:MAG: hypothetical protein OES29_13745, partial [Desulfuromonadales bacterium]|nr:hypothetical protein [Desulfuromonadales bacterium]
LGECIIYPPALFGECEFVRDAKFLPTLINNKRPPRIEPWWPKFCVLKSLLNTSINKKPVFLSEVVIYGNPYYAFALP